MYQRRYSTNEVANMVGLNQANLQKMIRLKRIPFPPLVQVGSLKIRLWTPTQIERLRKHLAKRRKHKGSNR